MTICPKCGKPNKCALSEGKPIRYCYCILVEASKKAKEWLANNPDRGEGCLCEECLTTE